jgi:CheY-like chemotaxis protein
MTQTHTAGSVLVVDDDTNLREGLCDILVEEGYMVDGAKDGADALEHLHDFALPDVVLLDLWMPGMDGYEFLKRRQQDELLKDVPVIVISATSDPDRLHFPLVATLNKPVNLTTLLRMIEKEMLAKHPPNAPYPHH